MAIERLVTARWKIATWLAASELALGWCAGIASATETDPAPNAPSVNLQAGNTRTNTDTTRVGQTQAHPNLKLNPSRDLALIKRPAGRGVKIRASALLGREHNGKVPPKITLPPTSALGGKVVLTEGWVVYQPPSGLVDKDSFAVTVDDPRAGQRTSLVKVEADPEPATSSNFSSCVGPDGSTQLKGNGIPGRVYLLEFALASDTGKWQPLGTVTADVNGCWEYVDRPSPGGPARIYRLRTE